MIFYFSATGNSKFIAETVAKECGGQIYDLAKIVRDKKYDSDLAGDISGIVAPVYFGGLPSVVLEFLENVKFKNAEYFFYVTAYGAITGATAAIAEELIKKQGITELGFFSVKTVDNWTPNFDVSNKSIVDKKLCITKEQAKVVAKRIAEKQTGNYMSRKIARPLVNFAYGFYDKARKTEHFMLDDTCIGCGLCAENCPVHAIKMQDAKPSWVKDRCAMCLKCIHRCPKFSIHYGNGKATRKHGQFVNPYVEM